jgi:hypothetical protein
MQLHVILKNSQRRKYYVRSLVHRQNAIGASSTLCKDLKAFHNLLIIRN